MSATGPSSPTATPSQVGDVVTERTPPKYGVDAISSAVAAHGSSDGSMRRRSGFTTPAASPSGSTESTGSPQKKAAPEGWWKKLWGKVKGCLLSGWAAFWGWDRWSWAVINVFWLCLGCGCAVEGILWRNYSWFALLAGKVTSFAILFVMIAILHQQFGEIKQAEKPSAVTKGFWAASVACALHLAVLVFMCIMLLAELDPLSVIPAA